MTAQTEKAPGKLITNFMEVNRLGLNQELSVYEKHFVFILFALIYRKKALKEKHHNDNTSSFGHNHD